MSAETMERTLAVGTPARVSIGNIRGSVDVRPGEEGVVNIRAVKHLDSGDSDTEVLIRQEESGHVRAETRWRGWGRSLFGRRRPCRVDYTVGVPPACDLEVKGVSSAAHIQGLQGHIDLESVSGDLTLRDLAGRIVLQTVSGTVRGERVSGPVRLATVSGDLHLQSSHLPAARAKTISGDIALETPLGEGPYRFESVSGDLRLVVPPQTACTVIGKSLSGRAHLALPSTGGEHRRGRWRFEVQVGGVEVHLESVSGSLYVEAAP